LAEAIKENKCIQSFDFAAVGTQIDNQTGVALAEAIKDNKCIQSFAFAAVGTQIDNQTGVALAEAITENKCMQSFTFEGFATQIDSQTGVALAEAIKENSRIQSFTFNAGDTQIDNLTGVALAEAIKENKCIQSFDFAAVGTQIDNQTGVALAEAIKDNTCIQSFTFYAGGTQIDNQTGVALAEAIKENIFIQSFTCDGGYNLFGVALTEVIGDSMCRNQALSKQRHALASVARCSADASFNSLKERQFRNIIFRFFLPPLCAQMPLEFVQETGASKKGATNEEGEKLDVAQSERVIEEISHEEPPAHIDPEVAHATSQLEADERWADLVERDLPQQFDEVAPAKNEARGVLLLRFGNAPRSALGTRAFKEALLTGQPLRACREAMAAANCSVELESEAKVFCTPHDYAAVLAAVDVADVELRPFHVLITPEFEPSLEDTLQCLVYKLRPCEKQIERPVLPLCAHAVPTVNYPDGDQEVEAMAADRSDCRNTLFSVLLPVQRTFLHFSNRRLRAAASVIQSTTDGHDDRLKRPANHRHIDNVTD